MSNQEVKGQGKIIYICELMHNNSYGLDEKMIIPLLNYLIKNHFPEIQKQNDNGSPIEECYVELYKEVVRRTAKLVALWQCYGFCHGVLNTDNMSILGLTIDYGPFGWVEHFNKNHTCNHSDSNGRYSYEN